jgi:hypothetical protein
MQAGKSKGPKAEKSFPGNSEHILATLAANNMLAHKGKLTNTTDYRDSVPWD